MPAELGSLWAAELAGCIVRRHPPSRPIHDALKEALPGVTELWFVLEDGVSGTPTAIDTLRQSAEPSESVSLPTSWSSSLLRPARADDDGALVSAATEAATGDCIVIADGVDAGARYEEWGWMRSRFDVGWIVAAPLAVATIFDTTGTSGDDFTDAAVDAELERIQNLGIGGIADSADLFADLVAAPSGRLSAAGTAEGGKGWETSDVESDGSVQSSDESAPLAAQTTNKSASLLAQESRSGRRTVGSIRVAASSGRGRAIGAMLVAGTAGAPRPNLAWLRDWGAEMASEIGKAGGDCMESMLTRFGAIALERSDSRDLARAIVSISGEVDADADLDADLGVAHSWGTGDSGLLYPDVAFAAELRCPDATGPGSDVARSWSDRSTGFSLWGNRTSSGGGFEPDERARAPSVDGNVMPVDPWMESDSADVPSAFRTAEANLDGEWERQLAPATADTVAAAVQLAEAAQPPGRPVPRSPSAARIEDGSSDRDRNRSPNASSSRPPLPESMQLRPAPFGSTDCVALAHSSSSSPIAWRAASARLTPQGSVESQDFIDRHSSELSVSGIRAINFVSTSPIPPAAAETSVQAPEIPTAAGLEPDAGSAAELATQLAFRAPAAEQLHSSEAPEQRLQLDRSAAARGQADAEYVSTPTAHEGPPIGDAVDASLSPTGTCFHVCKAWCAGPKTDGLFDDETKSMLRPVNVPPLVPETASSLPQASTPDIASVPLLMLTDTSSSIGATSLPSASFTTSCRRSSSQTSQTALAASHDVQGERGPSSPLRRPADPAGVSRVSSIDRMSEREFSGEAGGAFDHAAYPPGDLLPDPRTSSDDSLRTSQTASRSLRSFDVPSDDGVVSELSEGLPFASPRDVARSDASDSRSHSPLRHVSRVASPPGLHLFTPFCQRAQHASPSPARPPRSLIFSRASSFGPSREVFPSPTRLAPVGPQSPSTPVTSRAASMVATPSSQTFGAARISELYTPSGLYACHGGHRTPRSPPASQPAPHAPHSPSSAAQADVRSPRSQSAHVPGDIFKIGTGPFCSRGGPVVAQAHPALPTREGAARSPRWSTHLELRSLSLPMTLHTSSMLDSVASLPRSARGRGDSWHGLEVDGFEDIIAEARDAHARRRPSMSLSTATSHSGGDLSPPHSAELP